MIGCRTEFVCGLLIHFYLKLLFKYKIHMYNTFVCNFVHVFRARTKNKTQRNKIKNVQFN